MRLPVPLLLLLLAALLAVATATTRATAAWWPFSFTRTRRRTGATLVDVVDASRRTLRHAPTTRGGEAPTLRTLREYEVHDWARSPHAATRRALAQGGDEAPPRNLAFEIHALDEDEPLHLDLEAIPHEHVYAPTHVAVYVGIDGDGDKDEDAAPFVTSVARNTNLDDHERHTHYAVRVRGEPESHGVFTFVNGSLYGTVTRVPQRERSFSVMPLTHAPTTPAAPHHHHAVFRHLDMAQPPAPPRCGVSDDGDDDDDDDTDDSPMTHNANARVLQTTTTTTTTTDAPTKIIGLLICNDFARFLEYGSRTHIHTGQLTALANVLYSRLGRVGPTSRYSIRLQLMATYTFSRRDPWANTPGLYDAFGHAYAVPPSSTNANAATSSSVAPTTTSHAFATSSVNLLDTFNAWRVKFAQTNDTSFGYDVAHLLVGAQLSGTVVGVANTDSVCHAPTKSSLSLTTGLPDTQAASVMVHELGHTLGMRHTDVRAPNPVGTTCAAPERTYVMDPYFDPNNPRDDWSACDVAWLTKHFRPGSPVYGTPQYPACAEGPVGSAATAETFSRVNPEVGVPASAFTPPTNTCGDGFRDGTEECDCGSHDCTGVDPCCDGSTCTLKPQATCSAQDACCDASTCRITSDTSRVCRASAHDTCDRPERCDGINAACPADAFAPPGTSCVAPASGADGMCFYKTCHAHAEQCVVLGNVTGNAWVGPCAGKDSSAGAAACGSLHCADAAGTCYKVSAFVETGTPCMSGRACSRLECLNTANLPLPYGLSQCTNGVRDGGETDVDCGGPDCFPCGGSQRCSNSFDCAWPLECNATNAGALLGKVVAYGRCVPASALDSTGRGSSINTQAPHSLGSAPSSVSFVVVAVVVSFSLLLLLLIEG